MKKVALLGYGIVGAGVADILVRNAEHIAEQCGEAIELSYILDIRDHAGDPLEHLMVKDFAVIENDPEIFAVIEAIGGSGVALDFITRALKKGISAVTSNKQLVAEHGAALITLAKQNHCQFLFEASVGGGIPLLHPIYSCFSANEITEICGIMNGTTNYILTEMLEHGTAYDAALENAQKLGYAEANPTADVEGIDAGRKTCILADIAFGKTVSPEKISITGISGVTEVDAAFAEASGMKIKLLGRTVVRDGKHFAFVCPHFVPALHPLAAVSGVNNAVVVHGSEVGDTMFYGPGAGRFPTASAVVSDVAEIVQYESRKQPVCWDAEELDVCDISEFAAKFFFRTKESREACETNVKGITWIPSVCAEQGGITEETTLGALQKSGIAFEAIFPIL